MSGLLERFHTGDRQALARILTHIENQTDLGREALSSLSADSGGAHLIGLTGPPGAGKSTLANAMIREARRQDRRIAVLAIDPTSPFSGGATLGDRIRMLELQGDDGVYLRSMASRGQIGGLTLSAFGSVIALDVFGFDLILIETVGAGQDEVDVARLADTVIVVQTPGMGDSIQAVKAGILEIADLLVVNKSDRAGAADVVRDLRQQVRESSTSGWRVPVLPVTATTGEGVSELATEVAKHRSILEAQGGTEKKRARRLHHHAKMLAIHEFTTFLDGAFELPAGATDPESHANEMIAAFVAERGE